MPGHSGATAPVSHRLPRTVALMAANLSKGSAPPTAPIRQSPQIGNFHDTPDACAPRARRRRRAVRPSRSTSRSILAGSTRPVRLPRAWAASTPSGAARPPARGRPRKRSGSPRRPRPPSSTSATSAPGAGAPWPSCTPRTRLAVAAWMEDPAAAPHGGESLLALLERVVAGSSPGRGRRANGGRDPRGGHPRCLVCALDAPVQAFWRLDVAPLSRTVLHAHEGRWTVRGVNLPA